MDAGEIIFEGGGWALRALLGVFRFATEWIIDIPNLLVDILSCRKRRRTRN